jgi:AraC-like DNA-binding protein
LLREQRDDFFTKARWLEDYLLDKIRETSELHLAIKMKETLGKVKRHLWEGKRVDITDYTGYSRMHTYKLFSDWFGTGPSQTLRLHQFVHAVQLMHTQSLSLNQIGLASGFYDQAHFIRVFREFAAMTPGCYKKQMTDFPGQLFW